MAATAKKTEEFDSTARGGNVPTQTRNGDTNGDAITFDNACGFASRKMLNERDAAMQAIGSMAVAVGIQLNESDWTLANIRAAILRHVEGVEKTSEASRAAQRYMKLAAGLADRRCGAEWTPHDFGGIEAATQDMVDHIKSTYRTVDAMEKAFKQEDSGDSGGDTSGTVPAKVADKAARKAESAADIESMLRVMAIYAAQHGVDAAQMADDLKARHADAKSSIDAAGNAATNKAKKSEQKDPDHERAKMAHKLAEAHYKKK